MRKTAATRTRRWNLKRAIVQARPADDCPSADRDGWARQRRTSRLLGSWALTENTPQGRMVKTRRSEGLSLHMQSRKGSRLPVAFFGAQTGFPCPVLHGHYRSIVPVDAVALPDPWVVPEGCAVRSSTGKIRNQFRLLAGRDSGETVASRFAHRGADRPIGNGLVFVQWAFVSNSPTDGTRMAAERV